MRRMTNLSRPGLVGVLTVLVMLAALPGISSADMSITSQTRYSTSTLYVRGPLIAIDSSGSRTIINCKTADITVVSVRARKYWQGSLEEYSKAFQQLIQRSMEAMKSAMKKAGGSDKSTDEEASGPPQVRINKEGTEPVAGFTAAVYKVEYLQDGEWTLDQRLWLSPSLQESFDDETGGCSGAMDRINGFMLSSSEVESTDAYRNLVHRGYPIKIESYQEFFGRTTKVTNEVVTVKHDPAPDNLFTVPDNFRKIDSLAELMGS